MNEFVFPHIKDFCKSKGYGFEAIDLRWGVSQAASENQWTMDICIEELKRCQQQTPFSGLIILIGDKYGWRPLPPSIPVAEYKALQVKCPLGEWEKIDEWYDCDSNAVPPEYILRPRRGDLATPQNWEKVEQSIRETFLRCLQAGADIPEVERHKYHASATELEIRAGIRPTPGFGGNVFACIRTLSGLEASDNPALPQASREYLDRRPDGSWDKEKWQACLDLKEMLRSRLEGRVFEYEIAPTDLGRTWSHESGPLASLCESVFTHVFESISACIAEDDEAPPGNHGLSNEWEALPRELALGFRGRSESLSAIRGYLLSGHRHPFIIHGPPGSGKSSLVAMTIGCVPQILPEALVFFRFIGADGRDSLTGGWLLSLVKELSSALGLEESELRDTRQVEVRFRDLLSLANSVRRVCIFIDALDQLDEGNPGRRLEWLPRELGESVKLVLCIGRRGKDNLLDRASMNIPAGGLHAIPPLSLADGREILEAHCDLNHRTLTHQQKALILEANSHTENPLHFKFLLQNALKWRSFDPIPLDPGMNLPDAAHTLFWKLSQGGRHGHELLRKCLGYLAASRYGLSDSDVNQVLWQDTEVRSEAGADKFQEFPENLRSMPPVFWARVRHELRPYLTEREVFGTRLTRFFHLELAEIILAACSGGSARAGLFQGIDLREIHRELGFHFEIEGALGDVHALMEVIPQLVAAGDLKQAKWLLSNENWIGQKLKVAGIHALLEDYVTDALLEDGSLRLVRDALQLSMKIIESRPGELPAQLIGRLLRFEGEAAIGRMLENIRRSYLRLLYPLRPTMAGPGDSLVRAIPFGQGFVLSATIPDGGFEYLVGTGGAIQRWDVWKGLLLDTLRSGVGEISCMAVSQDGRFLVAGFYEGTLEVWDLASANILLSLQGHRDTVTSVAICSGGEVFLSGSRDGELGIWSSVEPRSMHRFQTDSRRIKEMALLPGEKTFITCSDYGEIRLWNVLTGQCHSEAWKCELAVTALFLTGRENTFWSLSGDGSFAEWDFKGNMLREFSSDQKADWRYATGFAIDKASRTAIIGYDAGVLDIWNLEKAERVGTLRTRSAPRTIGFCEGKEYCITGSGSTIQVHDISPQRMTSAEMNLANQEEDSVETLSLGSDGAAAVLTSSDHAHIDFVGFPSGEKIRTISVEDTPFSPIIAVCGGGTLALCAWNLSRKPTGLYDVATGCMLSELPMRGVESLAIDQNGNFGLALLENGRVELWSPGSGKPVAAVEIGNISKVKLILGADARICLAITKEGLLLRWILGSDLPPETIANGMQDEFPLHLSADGNTLVTSSHPFARSVWDVPSGRKVHYFEKEFGIMVSAMSTDGSLLVLASETVSVWETQSGKIIASVTGDALFSRLAISISKKDIVALDTNNKLHHFRFKH